MSQVKFRAWDKLNKVMLYDGIILDMSDCSRHTMKPNFKVAELIELMRFTGRLDKHGIPIYDSDIVKAPHDFGPGGFQERTFTVSYDVINGYNWQYWLMEEAEVIGNVYENPELLHVKE